MPRNVNDIPSVQKLIYSFLLVRIWAKWSYLQLTVILEGLGPIIF